VGINWGANWATVPKSPIQRLDKSHGIFPTSMLTATELTKWKPQRHRYVVREVALLYERMSKSGYDPIPFDANGLIVWGGDWRPEGAAWWNPERKAAYRRYWAVTWENGDKFFSGWSDDDAKWVLGATAVYHAWDRYLEIGGYRGDVLSSLAGSEAASMEDLFYAWAGPRPPEAEPAAWYVQAWPIWAAVGLYLVSGRR